jgi:hypothetical protein
MWLASDSHQENKMPASTIDRWLCDYADEVMPIATLWREENSSNDFSRRRR